MILTIFVSYDYVDEQGGSGEQMYSFVGHSNYHADAWVWCHVHRRSTDAVCSGLHRCHWTTPLGKYLLHIALATTSATGNKTVMQTIPSFCWPC